MRVKPEQNLFSSSIRLQPLDSLDFFQAIIMAQPILLPLRSTQPPSTLDLEPRLRQIEAQKGSFRTVTERSLQEDIDKAKLGHLDVVSESEDSDSEDESPESKQKKLWEAREEMTKQLLRAQNETLTALDSISLLISGHSKAGAGAKSSMSPALASAVPDSTLDAQKVRAPQLSLSAERQGESLYLGYRLEALNKAVDDISFARSRLSEKAQQESAFWKQVADLSAQGLVISRLPRDSRTIGIHFGLPEAAPRFRNRGFAVLFADQHGQLRLDQNIATARRWSVQISTFQNGKLTSLSRLPPPISTDENLATTVAGLRRSLFEEELFFEIGREARTIANQGVSMVEKTITAEITNGQKMQIKLVGLDEQYAEGELTDNTFADGILLCLRGLLSKGHEKSLARRSQPPPPLVPKIPPVPEHALLRPLLTHLRHQALVSTLHDYTEALNATMETAGLSFGTKYSSTVPLTPTGSQMSHHTLFLDTMLAPADSRFEIVFPTGRKREVRIKTHLAPPTFGTVFTISSVGYNSKTVTTQKMPNIDAVISTIRDVLTAEIVELIHGVVGSDYGTKERSTSKTSSEGVLQSHNASWHVKMNHDATLTVRYDKSEQQGITSPTEHAQFIWHAHNFDVSHEGGNRDIARSGHLIDIIKSWS